LEGVGVNSSPLPDPAFWTGKRVLLTGHTGFKGSWTTLWLAAMGAQVSGFALAPDTEPSLFELAEVRRDLTSVIGDIRDVTAVQAAIEKTNPEIVVHMAAQSLVRRSLAAPLETFATNVQGTAHLLHALRNRKALRVVLVITSDKVYANDARHRPFTENDALGGKEPYSASKAAAEIVAQAFATSYFDGAGVPVATARAGNIIGGGDFAPDRLIPDVIRAIGTGERLALRHPEATRPWQHVLDCVAGYLLFVEALAYGSAVPRALNFGPNPTAPVTVAELAGAVLSALGKKPAWDHVPDPNSIEMTALALDTTQARKSLGWRNRLTDAMAVAWTADWYRAFAAGADARETTLRQIADYQKLLTNAT
jgi:CDP-glucose 4,6-dehydratase